LLEQWAHVICPAGLPVALPDPVVDGAVSGADEDEPLA